MKILVAVPGHLRTVPRSRFVPDAGLDLRVFGPWRRKLAKHSPVRARLEHGFFSAQRMAEIFAACKATLNIHTWREEAVELRGRALEASASFRRDHSYRARVAELLRVVGGGAA